MLTAMLALVTLIAPDMISQATHLSLIKLEGPSTPGKIGFLTPARRLKDLGAPTEARFTLAHLQPLEPSAPYLLAPLVPEQAGRWRLHAAHPPCPVRRGALRAVEPWVRQWRVVAGQADLNAAAIYWISTVNHPLACARRLASEALLARADALRPHLSTATLRPLADALLRPGVPEPEKLQALELLRRLGGGALVVDVYDQLSSTRLKMAAVGILAERDEIRARRLLLRCAEVEKSPLKWRCARLLARISGE
ncbi:hypothetical protein KKF91_14680 [Myxococcota bacterium]|nr:hypothetical protein [Myxococcota bacterium]